MASTEPVAAPRSADAVEALAAQADAQAGQLPPHLVRVGASFAPTYQPVLEFAGWKVAMLRHFDVVDPAHLQRVERHWNTNEVFLLTAGEACLILLEGAADAAMPGSTVHVARMVPHVAYDVQQSVWHHVLMSPDAHIVLIERAETGPATTDYAPLTPSQCEQILAAFP